ncbi:MAG TPA: hybrid sensor histidine kinase/response regulator [Polyangiaceae bacterium]
MPRILHIEDDPANRLLVRKLLGPAGFEVIDAVDGLEGIRKALSERPDLVLVDIAIPGLDGYEVTLRLRADPSLRGMPIVAITAEGNRDASLAVGCDGFLQKPIDARSFAETVRGYLDGRRESAAPDAASEQLRIQTQRIVTHLEQKVAELMAVNRRLLELDQAKKEFYRNISHELATPMTPIVGYLKLLIDGELGELDTPQKKALRAMDDCVQRLRRLIDALLDVTALETGKMRFAYREYDLGDIVREAIARQPAFDAGRMRLVADLPRRGTLVGSGDVERLGRALDQLLDNATKFTPAGGTVGVRARKLTSGHLEVCIADTGPGVPAEKARQLFEPFYQVDGSPTRSHGGTGIGLAIVRGVAHGHGGDVRYASGEEIVAVPFTGAAFYLVIPERPALTSDPNASRSVIPPPGPPGGY